MTTLATQTTRISGHVTTGIVEQITAAVRAHLARMRARHEYRHLLECDDCVLRDVGITRTEVNRALHDC